jgi:EAL domain-containing protein (putative c-di-GMP-specific phosphodiesterase class I)
MQRHASRLGNAGLAVFALVAMGAAAYLLMAEGPPAYATAGAIVALAVGQLAILVAASGRLSRLEQRADELGRAQRDMAGDAGRSAARIGILEERLAQPAAAEPSAPPVAARPQQAAGPATAARPREAAGPAAAPEPPPAPHAAASDSAAPGEKPAGQERLDLLLEPVIELTTGVTAHYRARVKMVDEQGRQVRHDDLLTNADIGGLRPALDLHLLKLAMPILRRLRIKTPTLRLFIPVGSATLNAPEGIGQIAALLEINHDVAPGIVFDISHDELGKLDQRGIEELARLGRVGVVLALSRVSTEGLELAALRKLGVRFLDVEAAALAGETRWNEFSSYARAMKFQIIGGTVANANQAARVGRIARFGYGPYFAPPRKVKSDAGRHFQGQRSQAA